MSLHGAVRPILAALLAAASCATTAWAGPKGAGIDLEGMDRSVAPGDDFFKHANGAWLRTTEIPADRGAYGAGVIVSDRTDERTALLIQETVKAGAAPGSDARKIADYHASYMDEAGIEAKGLAPLQPTLDRIGAVDGRKALARVLGGTLRADVDAFNNTNFYTDNLLGLWVAQDLDDTTRSVPFLLQGGLDMPDRAYYVDASPAMEQLRKQCQEHIAAVLKLAKMPDADARAARVFELERLLAEAHVARQDSEDVKKANNRWSREEFDDAAPGLDWAAFLDEAGLGGQREFVVWQPRAVVGLAALVGQRADRDLEGLPARSTRSTTTPRTCRMRSGPSGSRSTGRCSPARPSAASAASGPSTSTNFALGEAVGRLYVERHFPPAAKSRVQEMVANIQAAFGRRIDALDWMAPETKAKAKAKLAVLKVGVGYPDRWRDYGALDDRAAATLSATPQRVEALRVPRRAREARPARRPRPNGS